MKIPYRFWLGVMIFMTTFTSYMLRSNLSVSIVSMVNPKKRDQVPPCIRNLARSQTKKIVEEKSAGATFNWTEEEQGQILTAYFYGYFIMSLPAGTMSEWIGPFHAILWTCFFSAVTTALTPLSTDVGFLGIFFCRFSLGLLGGFAYPAINVLIAHWSPPDERGKFLAGLMGSTLGTVITWNIVGAVTEYVSWDWGFYVTALLMGVCLIPHCILVSDTPEKSRWVSMEERTYIREQQEGHVTAKKVIPPYGKILLSVPFWSLALAQFGNMWTVNLILLYAPRYMKNTLGYKMSKTGLVASLPYLARLISSLLFGLLADKLVKKKFLPLSILRRFFVFICNGRKLFVLIVNGGFVAHVLSAACLFLIRFEKCNEVIIVLLLVLNQTLTGAAVVGHLANSVDIAPNFAGTLFGLSNFIGQCSTFVIAATDAEIFKHYGEELEASNTIFMIGGVVSAVCGVIFILFGSGEIQTWNEKNQEPQTQTT